MTFGGSWDEDNRADINNWLNDPSLGSFNINPRRTPKEMWDVM